MSDEKERQNPDQDKGQEQTNPGKNQPMQDPQKKAQEGDKEQGTE